MIIFIDQVKIKAIILCEIKSSIQLGLKSLLKLGSKIGLLLNGGQSAIEAAHGVTLNQ